MIWWLFNHSAAYWHYRAALCETTDIKCPHCKREAKR